MKLKSTIVLIICQMGLLFTACEDKIDPLITELQVSRVFSPIGLTAIIRNRTTVELTWNHRDDADYYLVEFSQDSLQFSNIILSLEVLPSEIPVQVLLGSNTRYSARVKAISNSGLTDSKWVAITVKTEPENIFLPFPFGARPQINSVTLKWQPGSTVTHISVMPGNIDYPLSDTEKSLGQAVVSGLSANTTYSFTLFNGIFNRGFLTTKTLKVANVLPTDNLVNRINSASDGEELILAPGIYTIGAVDLNKSITIEGQDPFDLPVVRGNFTCGTTVPSITFKRLYCTPDGTASQFFNALINAQITTLTLSECELSGYTNSIISSTNTGATNGKFGSIVISNCYVHDILPATGGDGLDFRAAGAIGNLQVENSTFANGFRSFLRVQATASVVFRNCTFFKICTGGNVNDTNNTGLFRITGAGSNFEVRNCLFVETGRSDATDPLRGGVWTRSLANLNVELPVYNNNNIYNCSFIFSGLYTSAAQVAASELNPMFQDATTGNFKVNNQSIIDRNVGDPRWLR